MMYRNVIIALSTGFGSSYLSKKMPGTLGTLPGVLLCIAISGNYHFYIVFTVILFFAGVFISTEAEKILGGKDPSLIVIDEIAGFLITMMSIPLRWETILSGFILFRLFDIFKPLKSLEDIKGGWGIMLDDAFAGVLANLILRIII